jgi:glycosyltransferase involved in cell wall biosynthesis
MQTCDIIMPMFRSARELEEVLPALYGQRIPSGWRLRLVASDDGSSDDTADTAARIEHPHDGWLPPVVVRNPHKGAAYARNAAIEASDADILFLLGADIVLRPGALALHLEFHHKNPAREHATLGMVRWDPRLIPTPFMEWMVHGGQQNDFDSLLGAETADPRHAFYGSHVSLKRKLLGTHRFSAGYKGYGWEDLDMGRLLAKEGIILTVLHKAVGLHRHYYSVDDILKRQYNVGKGVLHYQQQYPHDTILPKETPARRLKLALYRLSGVRWGVHLWLRMFAKRYTLPRLFMLATSGEFWLGVENSVNKKNA